MDASLGTAASSERGDLPDVRAVSTFLDGQKKADFPALDQDFEIADHGGF
jgi:hypothetical protein